MKNNKNLHGIVREEEILCTDVLLSSGIFPICKASGEKCIRCFAGQRTIPDPFLLYYFNTSKAKRFTLRLVVRDPWPLFEPGRLKGSIGRLFVPKHSLRKRKSLQVIRFITQLWKKRILNFTMIPPIATYLELQPSACISKT